MRFRCFNKTFILVHLSLNIALPRAKFLPSVSPVLRHWGEKMRLKASKMLRKDS